MQKKNISGNGNNEDLDGNVSLSDNAPPDFDPDSLVTELPFRSKKRMTLGVQPILEPPKRIKEMAEQVKEQIYEEFNHPSKPETSATVTPEEVSKNTLYPIGVLFLTVDKAGEVTIVGSLKGLSMLHGGEFLHLDLEVNTNSILPLIPKLENMVGKLNRLEVSSRGETITTEYKNKLKLKTIACKDFNGSLTQCKLVFVRG